MGASGKTVGITSTVSCGRSCGILTSPFITCRKVLSMYFDSKWRSQGTYSVVSSLSARLIFRDHRLRRAASLGGLKKEALTLHVLYPLLHPGTKHVRAFDAMSAHSVIYHTAQEQHNVTHFTPKNNQWHSCNASQFANKCSLCVCACSADHLLHNTETAQYYALHAPK